MSEVPDGLTVAEYLAAHGRFPLGEGLAVLDAILEVVGAAHRQGRVDGRLSPARVRILAPGRIALVSPGESGADPDADACRSPQQRAGKEPDVRADVYATGVIAYRMLLGVLPYADGDVAVDPHSALPGLADHVRRSLMIAVAPNLTERFGDALTFRAALRGESDLALESPTLRWAVAEGIPEGDAGAAEKFAASADSGDAQDG